MKLSKVFMATGSAMALSAFTALAAQAAPVLLFEDTFSGSSTSNVPGWDELQSSLSAVRRDNGYLYLTGVLSGEPDAAARTGTSINGVGYNNIYVEFSWRDIHAESSDDLNMAWAGTPIPDMSNEGAWNTAWSSPSSSSGTVSQSISPGADNSVFSLMFWTDVSSGNEGYKIDYVRVYGSEIAAVPLPAGGLLLLGGLGAMAGLRRKKKAA